MCTKTQAVGIVVALCAAWWLWRERQMARFTQQATQQKINNTTSKRAIFEMMALPARPMVR